MSSSMDIAEEGKLRALARDAADTRGPEDSMSELLNWNNLTYTMPVTNSVVTARNLKDYPADQNEYKVDGSRQILITMQSGQQYIDWSNSFLEFTLEISGLTAPKLLPQDQGADVPAFSGGFFWAPPIFKTTETGTDKFTVEYELTGHGGSVLNLFDRIVLTSRSGVELQRIDNFNKLHALETTMKKSSNWKKTIGRAIQTPPLPYATIKYDKTNTTHVSLDTQGITPEDTKTFYSIPMSNLMGLFDTKQLCPAMIASGLRIEIYLTDLASALTSSVPGYSADAQGIKEAEIDSAAVLGGTSIGAPGVIEYSDESLQNIHAANFGSVTAKITNMKIAADTITLNDAATKQLNMTSAANGLEYVYNGCFTQRKKLNSDEKVNIQCAKAVSRALTARAVAYETPVQWSTFNTVGRRQNQEYWKSHQWRLGSQYYPHQKVVTYPWFQNYQKLYNMIMYASDTLNKNMLIDYDYQRDVLEVAAPLPVVATLERSSLLRFSGVPINNSRTLSLEADLSYQFTGEILLFLDYVMLSKAFLNNIVVSV